MLYVKKVILLLFVYLLFYKPELFFIPSSLNLFFGVLGFIFSICAPKVKNRIFRESGLSMKEIFKYAIPFLIIAIVSCFLNFSFDLYYIKYFFSLVLGFYFSYFVALLFYNVYKKITFKLIIEYLLVAQFIYIVLSLLMFLNPNVNLLLTSMLKLKIGAEDAYIRTEGSRLLCFGASFFTSGIINGFVLILLSLYISVYKHSSIKQIILYLLFILIFAVGMMMARTSLVGAILAIVVLIINWLKSGVKILKKILIISFVCFLLLFLASKISTTVAEQIDVLTQFAFEMFINYESSDSFSTSSSNRLIEMYDTLPDNLKTWIIGDAKWTGSDGLYYMHTDVGYLRNIFYFGLSGMLALVLYYKNILNCVIVKKQLFPVGNKYLFITLFLYILIINLKGPADLYFYVIPFIFCSKYEHT